MIPARNLLAEVYHLLDNNRCFTFVSNLLNVARQLTGKSPYTYDAYELARTIATQPDGGISFYPGAGGGDAGGDIFSGNAKVGIFLFPAGSGRNPVGAQVSYALAALHEFIHLAGGADQYGAPIYSDYRLADAVKILTGASGYPSGSAPRTWEDRISLGPIPAIIGIANCANTVALLEDRQNEETISYFFVVHLCLCVFKHSQRMVRYCSAPFYSGRRRTAGQAQTGAMWRQRLSL